MTRQLILSLLLTAGLAACGNSGDPAASSPKVTVSSLPVGSYSVAIGDASAPTIGQYYASSDGTRLLVVNDDNALAATLYKGSTDGTWQQVPKAASDVSVSFLRSNALSPDAVDLGKLAGNYTVSVQGAAAGFSLASDGSIAPLANAACKLSGTVGADWVQGVRTLTLKTSGCSGLSPSLQGHLILDPDYAPAKLRLLFDDGAQISELWAYAD